MREAQIGRPSRCRTFYRRVLRGEYGVRRVQRDISLNQGDQCMLPGLTEPYDVAVEILTQGRGHGVK
jgi:hypothetical protein